MSESPIDLSVENVLYASGASQPTTENAENAENEENEADSRLRSGIWKHFKRIKIKGEWKACCKHCTAKISGRTTNGTSHLRKHYERRHEKKDNMRQQVLTSSFMNRDSPVHLTAYSFDHGTARKQLASAIIMHEYPLSIVGHIGFRRYSNSLQPLFKVPCRNTIKNEVFKIYEYEREKTMSLVVHNSSRLAVTTDMWTSSNQKKGFMAITSHFTDDSWTLQSRILRFIYVPCPHTKEVLCDQLLNCLMDWNIDRKISCITVDNCTTNDSMVALLEEKLDCTSLMLGGELFHMRCCAHILNLIVKDGLDVIKVGIEKIRNSVAYWTASPKREEKFEETVRQMKVPYTKKLGLDCATRWNSTFMMLQTALLYKDVFNRLSKRDIQYQSVPSEHEWGFAEDVCVKLKIFFKVTELFSGTKYPTTNQCFPHICEIRLALRDWLTEENAVIKEMARVMIIKFDKYWSIIHGVVAVSAVLDPMYKMDVLEFYFSRLFPNDYAKEVEKVRELCYKLLKEYQKNSSSEGIGESSSHSVPVDTETMSQYDLYMLHSKKRKIVDAAKLDLDHYLSEEPLPKTLGFDVLGWWKANEGKYPILQAMARDMLAIPVSTVASESAFSAGGRLVSPHRSRLHPDTMEALMCSQSWLWATEMKGDSSSGYTTIYDDSESGDLCVTREV